MKNIIFIIAFFVYSGYYAVLALIIFTGNNSNSREITLPLRIILTLLMVYVISVLMRKHGLKTSNKYIYSSFILFWLLYFIKVLFHYLSGEPLMRSWYEYIFYAVNFCILPFFMNSLIDLNKFGRTILNAFILSGFVMAVMIVILYIDVLIGGISRLSNLVYETGEETISPLALSYSGSLSIALCFYEILFTKGKKTTYKIYLLVVVVVSFIIFFLGASRGSIIALIFSFVYMLYFGTGRNRIKLIMLLILATPIVIWGVFVTGSSIFERTSNTLDGAETGRFELWNLALDTFYNNPIFGGLIEIVNAPGYNSNIYPHNILAETLMSTGLIGIVLLFLFLIPGWRRLMKMSKISTQFNWIGIILIQGLVQSMFSGAIYFSVLVFFPLGIIFSYNIKKVSSKKISQSVID